MNIAILTSGILPVPAVRGGAVENLTDFYLEYNERHRLHHITVYSIADRHTASHHALRSVMNHYHFIDTTSWLAKIRKHIFHFVHHDTEYYHYTIEYYLHQAIKDIRRRHYDIIILENRPAYALKLKAITSARLVYHLHNEKLDSNTPQYQEIYDAAWRILTVSYYIRTRVTTINPDDTKTRVVYNGINLQAFSVKDPAERQRSNDDGFLLIYSGRINREKGILELIKAMSLLSAYPKIKLMVIGSSFFGSDTSEDEFMRQLLTEAAPLKDRITFTGFIPYHEMPAYLMTADVAVIPSVWDDPFPTTVLEAQAMGKPIIATRRGGIPEEVSEENAILLDTDAHFIDSLAAAILDLYEHPEKRERMAAASIARSKMFDNDTYAANFLTAITPLQDMHPSFTGEKFG